MKDRNDSAAWRDFDGVYRQLVYRFAQGCGLGASDADDVTQQTMTQLLEHIGSFNYDPARGRFKSWLLTVAKNNVRKLRRRRREGEANTDILRVEADSDPGPDELFETAWKHEHLRHCLGQLRSEVESASFDAFRMYALEDRPVEEVCQRFGLTSQQLYKLKWRLTQRVDHLMHEILGPDE